MTDCKQDLCDPQFAAIHAKLDRLDIAIRGNGKPGIDTRLTLMEQDTKRLGRMLWLIAGAAVPLVVQSIYRLIAG